MKRANSENSGSTGESSGHNTPENDEQGFPPTKRSLTGTEDRGESDTEEIRLKMNGCARVNGENDEERIAILDFGAQYGKVIDRRVREQNVSSEMFPLSTKAQEICKSGRFRGIIISGGPSSVYASGAPQVDPEIFTCGLPVLGICYGFQLLNKWAGGGVGREKVREDGQTEVRIEKDCKLFDGLGSTETVLLTHGDSVTPQTVAQEYRIIASSGPHVAGIANEAKKLYGVQFHPEVDLTLHGRQIFHNFIYGICGCKGGFTMKSREQTCMEEIRRIVADQKVLVLVSGGVDSAVCAALLHKALGKDRVTAIHIDNGFMRYKESDSVITSLNALDLNVHRFNTWPEFYSGTVTCDRKGPKLDQTVEPEIKRQIIGNTFIRVKDRVMEELNLKKEEYFLAQGTLRPDLIESASSIASGHADTIKTHHNDTALVRELRKTGRVIEPLKDFHKDEVRELGSSLGLPDQIVHRHPFPGPGLAIRIICAERPYRCADFEETSQRLNILANLGRECKTDIERLFRDEILNSLSGWDYSAINLDHEVYTTLLPIKSVGVQGDSRSYSYVAALSCSADPIPWRSYEKIAALAPKLLHNINRVVYVFGGPVIYSIDNITRTFLTRESVQKLQLADRFATDALFGRDEIGKRDQFLNDASKKVQQMPVIMLPIHFDRNPLTQANSYQHSFCVRPFITADFMTGVAALPGRDIPEENVLQMVGRIKRLVPGTSRVMIDLTSKPPGTTEWE